MKSWKSLLKSDPIDWLLEPENPSVRYLALIDLLDRALSDKTVKTAKDEIMKRGVIPKILFSKVGFANR